MSKPSDLARSTLIRTLADGKFHSGEHLGQTLGLSRAAIANHVKVLSGLGLDIFSVTGKGYRLAAPLQLLDEDAIVGHSESGKVDRLTVLNIIDSTNQYIKDRVHSLENGHVCFAEAQTAGRGRHGRKWVSPYGASLYMTCFWSFPQGYQALTGLSLAIGVAIVDALEATGVSGASLKWPNDVYLDGKKLAGVLIEVEGQMGSQCNSIIGIGLNLNLPDSVDDIDQPWTDVSRALGETVDRNGLAARLWDSVTDTLKQFEAGGVTPFLNRWRALDIFRDCPVRLILGNEEILGIGRGVDANGAFRLDNDGDIKLYHGGEISVRPA